MAKGQADKGKAADLPPDQSFREQIANDLDLTMLVEAAAGTGKTTCLIARMVGLLREGKCGVETLAAVTFTRKAAAELRTRFQLALERAAARESGVQRERLAVALRRVERCFIGTIHSFCGRMLRERPVEAEVDPAFTELDDAADAELRRSAWREYVAHLLAADEPIIPELQQLGLRITASTRANHSVMTELDELGLEVAELGAAFLKLAEFPDVVDWPAETRPLPDLNACIADLQEYLAHINTLDWPEDFGNDALLVKYDFLRRFARGVNLRQNADLMEVLELIQGKPRIVHKVWPGKKSQAVAELARWTSFVELYSEPLLAAWREHRYEPIMRALLPALLVYDQMRRDRNALNFQDLLLKCAALLRDRPEVRRYFRSRFTHVLVDEFQDTDPIQAEVMLLLTADDCNQTDWRQCRPVPGSLFVVGDPKQSIYRFRRADIQTYNKVREIIVRSGGCVLPLSTNFRSVQPILQWVNGVFGEVFPSVADNYSPGDRPFDVECGQAPGGETLGSVVLLPAPSLKAEEAAAIEADWIARWIRNAIDRRLPMPRTAKHQQPAHATPGDFLIIVRKKKRLSVYARALQHWGLPHAITGGSVLNEVTELHWLHQCVSAVVHHDDPVALVAVLRGELFGVSDDTLYRFRKLGGWFSYRRRLPTGLDDQTAAEFRDVWTRLRRYWSWLQRMPPAAAVERIASDLGLIARACAAEQGDAHAGSLLKTIELLRGLEDQASLGDLVAALGRLVDQEEQHDGLPVRPHRQAPVRVMNIHQCKGLEAPIVFLADPAGEYQHDVEMHIDRQGEWPRGYLAIPGRRRGQWGPRPWLAHSPGWSEFAAEEQRYLDAENNRLLYVAATRAAAKLVIAQRSDPRQKANPWRLFHTYLADRPVFDDPGPPEPRPFASLSITPEQLRVRDQEREERWRNAIRPSYQVSAIKHAALQPGPKPRGAFDRRAQWGNVIHALLQAAMEHPQADRRGLALSLLEAEKLDAALLDDALLVVQRVVDSELWRRAARRMLATPRRPSPCWTPPPIRPVFAAASSIWFFGRPLAGSSWTTRPNASTRGNFRRWWIITSPNYRRTPTLGRKSPARRSSNRASSSVTPDVIGKRNLGDWKARGALSAVIAA